MENVGIWLDKQKAYLIKGLESDYTLETIKSNFTAPATKEAFGVREKVSPKGFIQEDQFHEREKHQLKEYFKEITDSLKNAKHIVIYGPSLIPKKFQKELEEQYPMLHKKVLDLIKCDSMTEKQLIAMVKKYYSSSIYS